MRIVYWSDFNCPYCYIGNTRLKKAVAELGLDVEWEMKAFELEPHAGREVKSSTPDRFAAKYGLSVDDAKARIDEINRLGRAEGLDFDYENTQLTSSFDAHRLIKLVQSRYPEKEDEVSDKLFNAYFSQNRKLADWDTLLEIAETSGIDTSEVREMLEGNLFEVEIQLDLDDARLNMIHAVPYYGLSLGDNKLIIPGAITKEEFKIALEDLTSDNIDAKTCGIGIC